MEGLPLQSRQLCSWAWLFGHFAVNEVGYSFQYQESRIWFLLWFGLFGVRGA
jgi:hypothetical protein